MKMKAFEFDKDFDDEKDLIDKIDLKKAQRPNRKQKRVNIDFPEWMVTSLDEEAKKIGVTRQSLIKLWIAKKLEKKAHKPV